MTLKEAINYVHKKHKGITITGGYENSEYYLFSYIGKNDEVGASTGPYGLYLNKKDRSTGFMSMFDPRIDTKDKEVFIE